MKRATVLAALVCLLALALGYTSTEKREEEISLRVNATLAAVPTQTPLPTHTLHPTYTPYPTYTLYPTHTPYPTYTPPPQPDWPEPAPPAATGPGPEPPPEDTLDRLAWMMWVCAQSVPEFREDFVEGFVESGMTKEVALAILENRENFRAVVRELAGEQDWLSSPEELNALIVVMESECGTEVKE